MAQFGVTISKPPHVHKYPVGKVIGLRFQKAEVPTGQDVGKAMQSDASTFGTVPTGQEENVVVPPGHFEFSGQLIQTESTRSVLRYFPALHVVALLPT